MSKPNERELASLSDAERAALAEPEGEDEGGDDESGVTDIPVAGVPGEKPPAQAADPAPAAAAAAAPAAAAAAPAPAAPEEIVPPLRLPEISVRATVPADLEAQFAKLDTDQAALDRKLDEGDLESKDYARESRKLADQRQELRDIRTEVDTVTRTNVATRTAHWNAAQATFFDRRAEFKTPIMMGALDAALRDLYANQKYAGADYNWLLAKAAAEVDKAMGKSEAAPAPPAATPGAKQATPAVDKAKAALARADADRKVLPTTLGGLPAADAEQPGSSGGEFSHLDNLSGMELEEAIAKMPREAADRYLSA